MVLPDQITEACRRRQHCRENCPGRHPRSRVSASAAVQGLAEDCRALAQVRLGPQPAAATAAPYDLVPAIRASVAVEVAAIIGKRVWLSLAPWLSPLITTPPALSSARFKASGDEMSGLGHPYDRLRQCRAGNHADHVHARIAITITSPMAIPDIFSFVLRPVFVSRSSRPVVPNRWLRSTRSRVALNRRVSSFNASIFSSRRAIFDAGTSAPRSLSRALPTDSFVISAIAISSADKGAPGMLPVAAGT